MGSVPMLMGGGDGALLRLLNVPLERTLDYEIFEALRNFDLGILKQRNNSKTVLTFFILTTFYLGLVYINASVGIINALKSSQSIIHFFLLGTLFYFIFISAGLESGSRFRIPIMPIFTIYAAQGISLMVASFPKKWKISI